MNWQVFEMKRKPSGSISDGTSNTVATAEHYAWYPGGPGPIGSPGIMCRSFFLPYWAMSTCDVAAFAYPALVVPVTKGTPPVSTGNDPWDSNSTFQMQPLFSKCNSSLAQTGHPGGMTVGFLDGSVRRYRPSIAPSVYWGSVTPDRGESIAID